MGAQAWQVFSRIHWRRRLNELDRFVMPPLCPFCRTPLQIGEEGLCDPCREDLPWNSQCCGRCALPLGTDVGVVCATCQAKPPPFAHVLAPFRFEFPVDAGLRRLKFRRRLEFVPAFASAMAQSINTLAPEDRPDLIVPVPLHFVRHGQRGFNQAELLGRAMTRLAGGRTKVLQSVERVRRTRSQTGLDTRERRENLVNAFRVRADVSARHVLVVDDVMTTGATVRELGRCLEEAGAARVSVLVAARRAL